MKKRWPFPSKVRVIVDVRNAALDRFISLSEAKRLYEAGVLGRDITNNAYCTLENGRVPEELYHAEKSA